MNPAEVNPTYMVLVGARNRVVKGWCQGKMSNGDIDGDGATCWCAWGAIYNSAKHFGQSMYSVTGPRWDALKAFERANALIGGLSGWNDTPGRTQAEVISAFDKAIGGCQ